MDDGHAIIISNDGRWMSEWCFIFLHAYYPTVPGLSRRLSRYLLIMGKPRSKILLLLLLALAQLTTIHAKSNNQDDKPEALFRQAAQVWRSSGDYQPWIDFSIEILARFDQQTTGTSTESSTAQQSSRLRLELIGALEESILMIEKSTLEEGENRRRDAALSRLYAAYGHTLTELSSDECQTLALDPHTLLIGADSLDKSKPPSSHLCIENAENSLRNAVTLDAANQNGQHLLEGLLKDGGADVHTRKPKEFVAELFDSFADTFDEKLLKGLQYKVPKLVGDTVQSLRPKYSNALDAGCGTGLAGRFLRQIVTDELIGVDASKKMLDKAAKCTLSSGCGLETLPSYKATKVGSETDKALYDGLLVMDLEAMTVSNTLHQVAPKNKNEASGFDLIVAADVLVYFGSLESLLRTFAEVSVPEAALVFSCERTTEEEAPLGWRLLPSGRFAHTKQHVEEVAQKVGYKLVDYQEIVPRMEKGKEVQGHLFAYELQKKHSEL